MTSGYKNETNMNKYFSNIPLPTDSIIFPWRSYSNTAKKYNFHLILLILILTDAVDSYWKTNFRIANRDQLTGNQLGQLLIMSP